VSNLILLLVLIFGGVALMVVLGERFAQPMEPEKLHKLRRWIMPLVGLVLVLSLLDFYFF